jgi:cytidine deaminase
MPSIELKDRELIENARAIITKRFKENYHHIGAALQNRERFFPLSI